MSEFTITDEQQRCLSLVAKHGAEHVSRSMSRWLRESISMNVTSVEIVHYSSLPEQLGTPGETVAAILIPLTTDLRGMAVFLFDEQSALQIVGRILQREEPLTEWDVLAESAMEETGNIVGTAFLNGLSLALNLEIHPEAPTFLLDYTEAILDPLMVEIAMAGEHALLFDAVLESDTGTIHGQFSLLPDADCFDNLIGSIERARL